MALTGHRAEGAQCSGVIGEVRERAAGALGQVQQTGAKGHVPGEAAGGARKKNLTPELILSKQRCISEFHDQSSS